MTELLLAALLLLLPPQGASNPAAAILGEWRGTSLCVDKARDTACRDEQTIYTVDSASTPRGPVRMQADKIVNGRRLDMGVFRLKYDSVAHVWSQDMHTPSGHDIVWSFAAIGDSLTGTLVDLPGNRLVRRVSARRQVRP